MGTVAQLSMMLAAAAWAVGAMGLAAAMHGEPRTAPQVAYYNQGQESQLNSQQKKDFDLEMASRESNITDGSRQHPQPAPLRRVCEAESAGRHEHCYNEAQGHWHLPCKCSLLYERTYAGLVVHARDCAPFVCPHRTIAP